jgi:hypothetical protein
MTNELQAITQNPNIAWWKYLIPIMNIIFQWSEVPQEMQRAKQMMGCQIPARSTVVYVFFYVYALAADLNDMAQPGT